ncbi:hypothetical protein OUZ56_033481 [Daphnia magna]|uniref:Uncharacterized protein n=1 Tax=Daphnia magna TaxID=35525 RepID=A0ABR0BAS1_9CRUS|nr:hypothetical protein OUZ56_033481 [Daphnia magna]
MPWDIVAALTKTPSLVCAPAQHPGSRLYNTYHILERASMVSVLVEMEGANFVDRAWDEILGVNAKAIWELER